jgi:hypothetical protein
MLHCHMQPVAEHSALSVLPGRVRNLTFRPGIDTDPPHSDAIRGAFPKLTPASPADRLVMRRKSHLKDYP